MTKTKLKGAYLFTFYTIFTDMNHFSKKYVRKESIMLRYNDALMPHYENMLFKYGYILVLKCIQV